MLASGSTGNAVYVEAGFTRVLIDSGIGIKQLRAALETISASGEELDAILVTHEHSDHVKGVTAAVRKWHLPIYTSDGTWSRIARMWKEDEDVTARIVRAGVPFALGELVVHPFALSHDAEEPLGFCLHAGGHKLVLATDLGYANDRVKDIARGAHTYILETNHDVDLLRNGPYPWHLKRRILGDKGHLSNDSAAAFLLDCLTDDTESVFLAHLSQENNRPELARDTVADRLASWRPDSTERIALRVTSPKQATALFPVCTVSASIVSV